MGIYSSDTSYASRRRAQFYYLSDTPLFRQPTSGNWARRTGPQCLGRIQCSPFKHESRALLAICHSRDLNSVTRFSGLAISLSANYGSLLVSANLSMMMARNGSKCNQNATAHEWLQTEFAQNSRKRTRVVYLTLCVRTQSSQPVCRICLLCGVGRKNRVPGLGKKGQAAMFWRAVCPFRPYIQRKSLQRANQVDRHQCVGQRMCEGT